MYTNTILYRTMFMLLSHISSSLGHLFFPSEGARPGHYIHYIHYRHPRAYSFRQFTQKQGL